MDKDPISVMTGIVTLNLIGVGGDFESYTGHYVAGYNIVLNDIIIAGRLESNAVPVPAGGIVLDCISAGEGIEVDAVFGTPFWIFVIFVGSIPSNDVATRANEFDTIFAVFCCLVVLKSIGTRSLDTYASIIVPICVVPSYIVAIGIKQIDSHLLVVIGYIS